MTAGPLVVADRADEAEEQLATGSPALIDGHPIRMPICVTASGPAIALWQVSVHGHPVGAWTYEDDGTPEVARTILSHCDRRALLLPEMKDVALLQALGLACGVEVGELTARLLDLERVLQDADAARRTYQQAVVDIGKESGTRYASLS